MGITRRRMIATLLSVVVLGATFGTLNADAQGRYYRRHQRHRNVLRIPVTRHVPTIPVTRRVPTIPMTSHINRRLISSHRNRMHYTRQ